MSVVMRRGGALVQMVKGAPESVLDVCTQVQADGGAVEPLTADRRAGIEAVAAEMASDGRRLLGLAMRPVEDPLAGEEGLVFLGLVGMIAGLLLMAAPPRLLGRPAPLL